MGKYFIDQYSLLHFASGILAFYWNIDIKFWVILHSIFEFSENTQFGVNIINNYVTFWPGGKPYQDSFSNIFGDTFFAIFGWCFVFYYMHYTKKHIK